MADATFVVEVTTQDFVKVVLEGSSKRPVLVDFWANWCAPCKALGPILEKMAQEFGSKLLVAKVDTDKEQSIAQQLGIRSLPTVRLFHHGRVVDEFMGLLPEADVRAFLNRHIQKAADHLLQQAETLIMQGRFDQALNLVERARAEEPNSTRAILVYARIKVALGEYDAAERLLDSLPLQEHNIPEAKALRAMLVFERTIDKAPASEILVARLAANPKDSEARYQLAAHHVGAGAYSEAMDELLFLIRKDRSYGEDAARKGMLGIFDMLGGSGELVDRYRTKLTNTLF